MKRAFVFIIGVLAALGIAGNAAADYPVGTPTVSSSSSSPTAGDSITLTANDFCPGATVVFSTGDTVLGQAIADGDGTATLVIPAPGTPGTYVITAASSGNCVASASLSITVRARGGIPATGSDSSSTVGYALLAVGAGAALMAFAGLKRRRPAVA